MEFDEDLFRKFTEQLKDEGAKMQKANIMVVGKTGAGKSTLINGVFREDLARTGIGTPVTQHLQRIEKEGVPVRIYDTKGLELNRKVQEQTKKEILGEIELQLRNGKPEDHVHLLWYCLSGPSKRIEDFEIDWIRSFTEKVQVVVVITQCFSKDHAAFAKYVRELNLPVRQVVAVLAQDYEIDETIRIPAFGLVDLADITLACLPEAARSAFVNAQKVDLQKKLDRANAAVVAFVTGAFATGFTPLPFSDAAVLVPLQMGMITSLTAIFGIPLEKSLLKAIVTAVGGSGGAVLAGKSIVAAFLKFFPGAGTLAGGFISGTTAAIITGALGYGYNLVMIDVVKKLYAGEKVSEQDILDGVKTAFKNQLKRGKDLSKAVKMQPEE